MFQGASQHTSLIKWVEEDEVPPALVLVLECLQTHVVSSRFILQMTHATINTRGIPEEREGRVFRFSVCETQSINTEVPHRKHGVYTQTHTHKYIKQLQLGGDALGRKWRWTVGGVACQQHRN